MHYRYIVYLFEFMLTNILFSLAWGSLFTALDGKKSCSRFEIYLFSLGLGPAFTTMFLYYMLLLMPRRSSLFYFSAVCCIHLALLVVFRKSLPLLFEELRGGIKAFAGAVRSNCTEICFFNEDRHTVRCDYQKLMNIFAFVFITLCVLFLLYVGFIAIGNPLLGHDISAYGVRGNLYFSNRAITYTQYPFDPATGYVNYSRHAPSFPLLLTWERITEELFGVNGDVFFRIICIYYFMLIVSAQVHFLSKRNLVLAFIGILALVSSTIFFRKVVYFHVDTYRIFFLSVSFIFFVRSIRKGDNLSLLLFTVFAGFSAFAHSLGLFIALFCILAILFIMKSGFFERLGKVAAVTAGLILIGGTHYVIDTFLGTGWIFR